jgi:hypothetical protein
MAMRVSLLASAFVFATVTAAVGQNPADTTGNDTSKLLDIAQSGNAAAKTKYAVEGVAVGSPLKADNAASRDYKCSPSEQFEALTWCQKTRADRTKRGPFAANYSVLHSERGNVVYVNRRQEPSFLDRSEVDKEIKDYAHKLGSEARITHMPHRGAYDGVIALWGEATLEPLDADSMKVLAEGKSPKKGLLVDFLGNFTRSAKEGLPVYRISGGAGFLWAASFDQGGRGALRVAAVDASALPSPAPANPAATLPPPAPVLAAAEMQPALPVQQVEPVEQVEQVEQAGTAEPDVAELKQTVQALKAQLAKSAGRIAQLEKEVAETAPRAGVDTDDGPLAEGTDLAAVVAQLRAEKAALVARTRTWGVAGVGAIIGLIVFMVLLVPGRRARKAAKADTSEAAPAEGTGKIDEGNLIHQLAETLGVDEAASAMPQLSPTPSGSLVPASPAEGAAEEGTPGKSPQRADVAPAVPLALAAPAPTPASAAIANIPGA